MGVGGWDNNLDFTFGVCRRGGRGGGMQWRPFFEGVVVSWLGVESAYLSVQNVKCILEFWITLKPIFGDSIYAK